jgi:hypothetical protein
MRHIIRTLIPAHAFLALIVTTSLAAQVSDSLVIPADKAGVRTVGGRVEGGWNLWSDGRVGPRVKSSRTGLYTVVIRAWGSPAAGTWPRWLCSSMDSRSNRCRSIAIVRRITDLLSGEKRRREPFLDNDRVTR